MSAWLEKFGTLLSQSINALLLGGNPDQSISSRAWGNRRTSRAYIWIDALFGSGHCEKSFDTDVAFAEKILQARDMNKD